jgi:hypothetical protein
MVRQREPCSALDAAGKDAIAGQAKNGTMPFPEKTPETTGKKRQWLA